jgi:capsular exopolysaccharide synthesis family protein
MESMGLPNVRPETENYDTDIALSTIHPILEKVIASLYLKQRNGEPMEPEKLVKSGILNKLFPQPYIEVEQYQESELLEIVGSSADSDEAVNLANTLAKLYIESILERNAEEYKLARDYIEKQVQKIREDYYNTLSGMSDFMMRTGVVDLDQKTQELMTNINELTHSYEEAERSFKTLEKDMAITQIELQNIEEFRKESQDFAISDHFNRLKEIINDSLVTLSAKSIDIQKEHPDYKGLENKIEAAKALLHDEVMVAFKNERLGINPLYEELSRSLVENYIEKEVIFLKKRLIKKYIDAYKTELLKIPLLNIENSKLGFDLNMYKSMYQKVMEYFIQVGMAESVTLSNIRVVEEATPPIKPEFPNKPLNYLLGIFLGAFWSLAIGFFIEYIDISIKTPEDIKSLGFLKPLGVIAKSRYLKKYKLISAFDPTLPEVETFRKIRNNINFTSKNKTIKVIAITSSTDFEGKSSIAANLCIAYSTQGRKVIAVDLNLRRPDLHNFFGLNDQPGIANCLEEQVSLEEAIVSVDSGNLDFLPAGTIPTDPSRLIESPELSELVQRLVTIYDVVIFDTPPVLEVIDPIVLGKFSDGILFVVESTKVSIHMLEQVKYLVDTAGQQFIGAVLNKARFFRKGHYYCYY